MEFPVSATLIAFIVPGRLALKGFIFQGTGQTAFVGM
jgi:hypothetical protein